MSREDHECTKKINNVPQHQLRTVKVNQQDLEVNLNYYTIK